MSNKNNKKPIVAEDPEEEKDIQVQVKDGKDDPFIVLEYLARDLAWLEGLAEGIDCVPLKKKINGIRVNLRTLENALIAKIPPEVQ